MECWELLRDKLDKYPYRKFIHTAEEKIIPRSENNTSAKSRGASGKPRGLWYSCGSGWLDWCLVEDFGFGPHLHELTVDVSKLKIITNEEEYDFFSKEYGISINDFYELHKDLYFDKRKDFINWGKVAESFAGIEINPYLWQRRLDGGLWYYGWDCASGVIWDKEAILDVELIAFYENGTIIELVEL